MTLNPDAVGRAVGEIRTAKGLTQKQLAAQTGLTVNFLSLLENGRRGASLDVVNKLAAALGVPAEFILFLAGDGRAGGRTKAFGKLAEVTKDAIRALIAAEPEPAK